MKSIVFTFLRAQPPTRGHERVVSKVVETAKSIGGDHRVYLSHTHKSPTDPLEWHFKRRVCESAFKGVNISKDETIRNPFMALESFIGKYDKVVLVVGSDRLTEFAAGMPKYAKQWGLKFDIVSAGDRIDEADDVSGMSGTKMRKYAADNNVEKFYSGLPESLSENLKNIVLRNTKKGLKKT
jgi:hypothetical protein